MKLAFSKGLKNEKDRLVVYSSLSTDEKRNSCINKLSDYHKQAELVASFDDDDLKVEYIFSGLIHSSCIGTIAASMKGDKKKEELIDLIPSDTARLRVILSIQDSEIKRRLFDEKLDSDIFKEKSRAKLIRSYPIVEQLQHFSEYSDGVKYMILQDCDYETQLRLLPELSDPYKKSSILEFMPSEFIMQYMSELYSDITNYWVRTDSEEREANTPRDDREMVASEIVKYSSLSDEDKVNIINWYITNKETLKEILKGMPYDFVVGAYFEAPKGIINIEDIDSIQELYDIESQEDVSLTASERFDLESPENKELIARVKKMKYPKFCLQNASYAEYNKWNTAFEGSDVIIIAETINISGENLTLEELEDLTEVAKYVMINDRYMADINRYRQALELSREIFPLGEDEKYDAVRGDIEVHLTASGQIGATLIAAERVFGEAGFSDEEIQFYGEKLLAGLHSFDPIKYPKLRYALDEDSVELIHRWDATKSILRDELVVLTEEMTKAGIKRAVELASEDGLITEEFAVCHMLDFLSSQNFSNEGLEYGQKIALELMQKQSLGVKDIERMNPGAYSDVYKIGDFVLKLGFERKTKPLPEHPRILPSLLRFEVKAEDGMPGAFVEVQPTVIPYTTLQGKELEEKEVEIYKVFEELRSNEILWGDVAGRNLGYVATQIQPIDNLFADLKGQLETDDKVTIYHIDNQVDMPQASEDILSPYLYVIDTDFLYQLNDIDDVEEIEIPSSYSMEFEEKYKSKMRGISPSAKEKRKRKERDLMEQINELY